MGFGREWSCCCETEQRELEKRAKSGLKHVVRGDGLILLWWMKVKREEWELETESDACRDKPRASRDNPRLGCILSFLDVIEAWPITELHFDATRIHKSHSLCGLIHVQTS